MVEALRRLWALEEGFTLVMVDGFAEFCDEVFGEETRVAPLSRGD
jgi:hypothetical protein